MFDCKTFVGIMLMAVLWICTGTFLAGQDVHSQKVAVALDVDGSPADPASSKPFCAGCVKGGG